MARLWSLALERIHEDKRNPTVLDKQLEDQIHLIFTKNVMLSTRISTACGEAFSLLLYAPLLIHGLCGVALILPSFVLMEL
mmetsp:Transcript_20413/g.28629  ORF Transcript_20413/g.28629 Transcript_20413/m.28629 type:complete len:81 (-) Transcript_20413:28-270(-)